MRTNCESINKPIKFSQKASALQKQKKQQTKNKKNPKKTHKISFPTLTKNIKMQIH